MARGDVRTTGSDATPSADDSEWLKGQLAALLEWEPFMAEGLIQAVSSIESRREVEDLVEGVTGGSVPAKEAVLRYWQSVGSRPGMEVQTAAPSGTQAYRKAERTVKLGAQNSVAHEGPKTVDGVSRGGNAAGGRNGKKGAGRDSAAVHLPPPSQPVAGKDGAKVLDMGVNIPVTYKKGKAQGAPKGSLVDRLERPVVNCLSCGRIFDCRAITNNTIQFLESGGICTFCGNQVALRYHDGSAVQPAAAASSSSQCSHEGQHQQQHETTSGTSTVIGGSKAGPPTGPSQGQAERQVSEAEAAALELKNRLVEYDRNSAKRTTVIDDQSDFFEIDSNAWLTAEERTQLKQRQQEMAAAEEARRQRVTVTIDLLGRKVLMVDNAELAAARPAAHAAAHAATEAAKATASEEAQGGGSAAKAALERAEETLRSLRISVNPSLAAASYVFLPPPATAVTNDGSSQPGGGKTEAGPGPATATGVNRSKGTPAAQLAPQGPGGEQAGKQEPQRRRAGKQRRGQHGVRETWGPSRLQHDDPFLLDLETAVEVLAEDEAARAALEQSLDEAENGAFDLCPPQPAPGMAPLAPLPAGGPAGRQRGGVREGLEPQPRVQVVQPGMVLLRGWLSVAQQADIVSTIRVLGMGPGGFYTPSYSTGGQLSLRMMCLGWHWEPRTSCYEKVRSSHDGATPPPIPPSLLDLVQSCMDEAQMAVVPGELPRVAPDICLVNYYDKQGKLGLHQDKDESQERLRAGIPVVSFSIGDAADFVYGRNRDEEQCKVVRLESGDVLVFGGPSRMIYHAVRAVHLGSAPKELLQLVNLRPGRLNLTFRQL